MRKYILSSILIAVTFSIGGIRTAVAQTLNSSEIMYHSFRSPMVTRLNPAAFPSDSKFYISFPRTGIGLSLPFSYSDLAMHREVRFDSTTLKSDTTTIVDLNKLIDNLTSTNGNTHMRLGFNFDEELLGFGFNVKNLYFNFAFGVSANANMTIPLNALRLLTEGNRGKNSTLDLGTDDLFAAQAYAYTSLGFAMKIPYTAATIGARLNMLYGLQVAAADNANIVLTTDSVQSQMRLNVDFLARTAGVLNLVPDTNFKFHPFEGLDSWKDYIPKNLGFTFDLGAKYEYKNFIFSASILNIGPGIHWTQNSTTFRPNNTDTLYFDGVDIEPLIVNGEFDEDYGQKMLDSVLHLVDTSMTHESFWCGVPTKFYLGASYSLKDYVRFGVLFHGEWDHGTSRAFNIFRQNTTLSVHVNVFDWLEVAAANSFTFDGKRPDAFNPALSISFNLARRLQFYATIDYLSNLYATNMKAFHLYFGANIVGKTNYKEKHSSQERLRLEVE